VVPSWEVVPDPDGALARVTAPGFDSTAQAILEQPPATVDNPSAGAGGSARYAWMGTQAARIEVDSSAPAFLTVRNTFDPNWHAWVDGIPAALMRVDYFLQGLPVPAGRHVVDLRYDDPSIGYGLLGTIVSLTLLLVGAFIFRGRRVGATASQAAGSSSAGSEECYGSIPSSA
jgi:hypothetical protein